MGLVGARSLARLVRMRSPISKTHRLAPPPLNQKKDEDSLTFEAPGDSKIQQITSAKIALLPEGWVALPLGLRYFYFLLGYHFSYSSPFVLFCKNEAKNQVAAHEKRTKTRCA